MELASRVYDIVTNRHLVTDEVKDFLPELNQDDTLVYWRRVLRMAALCHDVGHLPFSHAAEKELLPEGWDHEKLTREIISSDEMKEIWNRITPPLRHQDIELLAVGPKRIKDLEFSVWQTILSEIIVGDAFGVDRMDYLLRDSHHAGVAYGRFDHYRLIDTLRILPAPISGEEGAPTEPALGVEEGGIQSAEALMLARYFMYSQVYFHPIRRVYDIHLMDFLKEWLRDGTFAIDLPTHLAITDNEVTAGLLQSAYDETDACHPHSRRIIQREHFKRIYERNPKDVEINPEAGEAVFRALCNEFGFENFRHDRYRQTSGSPDFPVRLRDDRIVSSLALSGTLNKVPVVSIDYVFSERSKYNEASEWLTEHLEKVIQPIEKEGENG